MFHVGIVLEIFRPDEKNVFSGDNGVQATCKMWDEKTITLSVHSKLCDRLKKKDVVLVDYRPASGSAAPRMKIIKILEGKKGEQALKNYDDFREQASSSSNINVPFPKQHIS